MSMMLHNYLNSIESKKKSEAVKSASSPIVEEPEVKCEEKPKKFTKSEIQLMKVDNLKEIANSLGIEATDKTGTELKREIIKLLGL